MAALSLVVRAGAHLCAVRLSDVIEVMRPLPTKSLTGVPPFVLGLSVIRAMPTPVVSLASLLGGDADHAGRFVTIRDAGRTVAFAVDEVVGVREIPPDRLTETSPLLGPVTRDVAPTMGMVGTDPLLILGNVRLVPESVWQELDAARTRAG